MDRQIVYPGQIPLETDLLNSNKFAMVGLAKLAAAMLGTATVVNGLGCVPTTPASLQVQVNPGEMYSLAATDSSAYSSLSADAHNILKQGISLDAVTLTCTPPATGGQSINYLIQAVYQDQDTGLVTLPYYNASNPSQAWSGPNNTGAQQATARKGIVTISAKAGIAATTGSQTTPAPDAGYTGLWVVAVANGQTTITSANIAQATNAPILPSDLLHAIQASSLINGTDTGAANACVVSYSYPVTALTDGMVLWFKAKAANAGAATLNVNGLGAQPVVGGNHSALQGGEIIANGKCQVVWNATISSFVLVECTGAAVQVAPATQSQHAVQFGQLPIVVGTARNVRMGVAPPSSSATLTADEIVVETALGGVAHRLANFSQTINLATTGAGGMDTGSAPVNGFVAIYAMYNPTANTRALVAQNANALRTETYTGANAPAGFTESALVSVWPTNGSGQLVAGIQFGRVVSTPPINVLNAGAATAYTSFSIAGPVPINAKFVSGNMTATPGSASSGFFMVSEPSNEFGLKSCVSAAANQGTSCPFSGMPVFAAQTLYYKNNNASSAAVVTINGYEF